MLLSTYTCLSHLQPTQFTNNLTFFFTKGSLTIRYPSGCNGCLCRLIRQHRRRMCHERGQECWGGSNVTCFPHAPDLEIHKVTNDSGLANLLWIDVRFACKHGDDLWHVRPVSHDILCTQQPDFKESASLCNIQVTAQRSVYDFLQNPLLIIHPCLQEENPIGDLWEL